MTERIGIAVGDDVFQAMIDQALQVGVQVLRAIGRGKPRQQVIGVFAAQNAGDLRGSFRNTGTLQSCGQQIAEASDAGAANV